MKKILSSILVGTMLVSSVGVASVFAADGETTTSAVAEQVDESYVSYLVAAKDYVVEKAQSAVEEVNQNRNKYAIIAGSILAGVMAGVAAAYFGPQLFGGQTPVVDPTVTTTTATVTDPVTVPTTTSTTTTVTDSATVPTTTTTTVTDSVANPTTTSTPVADSTAPVTPVVGATTPTNPAADPAVTTTSTDSTWYGTAYDYSIGMGVNGVKKGYKSVTGLFSSSNSTNVATTQATETNGDNTGSSSWSAWSIAGWVFGGVATLTTLIFGGVYFRAGIKRGTGRGAHAIGTGVTYLATGTYNIVGKGCTVVGNVATSGYHLVGGAFTRSAHAIGGAASTVWSYRPFQGVPVDPAAAQQAAAELLAQQQAAELLAQQQAALLAGGNPGV